MTPKVSNGVIADGIEYFLLDRAGYVLVLETQHVFSVPAMEAIEGTIEQLCYRLEDELPLNADCIGVSFLRESKAGAVLAIDGSRLKTHIDSHPTLVKCQCLAVLPLAMIAWQRASVEFTADQYWFVNAESIDVVRCLDGEVQDWQWQKTEQMAQLLANAMAEDTSIAVIWLTGPDEQSLDEVISAGARIARDWSQEDWVRDVAIAVADGRAVPVTRFQGPAVNFVDASRPAKRSMAVFAASLLVAILALTVGLLYRARQYEMQSEQLVAQQEAIYTGLFPKRPIPVGIVSACESEARRLRATRGNSAAPSVPSIIPVMHAFMNALPAESVARFEFNDVVLTSRGVDRLAGRARGWEDLDQLRSGFSSANFTTPPLATRRDQGGASIQWTDVVWGASSPNRPVAENASRRGE